MLTSFIEDAILREAQASVALDGQTRVLTWAIKVIRMPDGSLCCEQIAVDQSFFEGKVGYVRVDR